MEIHIYKRQSFLNLFRYDFRYVLDLAQRNRTPEDI